MVRHKTDSPPVKMTQYFDHTASDLVDVFPNPDGEFVQVWSAPRGVAGRTVILAYLRTPHGPVDVTSRIELEQGPWDSIDTTGPRRTFYYRDDGRQHRYEEILPSGRMLVSDERNGLRLRAVWTEAFDWESLRPKGRPLGDRAVMKRQDEGGSYFVATYQQSGCGTGAESERLVCVVEYCGRERVSLQELPEEKNA